MCNHSRTVQYHEHHSGRLFERCRECKEELEPRRYPLITGGSDSPDQLTLETGPCPHNNVQVVEVDDYPGEPGYGWPVTVEAVECLACGDRVYDDLYPAELVFSEEIPF